MVEQRLRVVIQPRRHQPRRQWPAAGPQPHSARRWPANFDMMWLSRRGDQKYADAWRNMINSVNSNAVTANGRTQYPTMYGANGWYGWRNTPWSVSAHGSLVLSRWKPEDMARVSPEE